MRNERIALTVVIFVLLGLPGLAFGYQAARTHVPGVRVIDLLGYAPADGGWQPDAIRVSVGERVRLRIAAQDVVHSLAIPALAIDVPEILPGHVAEVEFVASQPGRYAFACTRWCSADHWRMRGLLEVVDPQNPPAAGQMPAPPLYVQLGLDIDAMRLPLADPPERPATTWGAGLAADLPAEIEDVGWQRAHSPAEAWAQLRADPALQAQSDAALWDGVAYAWQAALPAGALEQGDQLYARDCAACHGEAGQGDGLAGRDLPGLAAMHPDMPRGPSDFTDLAALLTAPEAVLHGKVLRGGMGTGMPEWGSLYTDEEIWAVVAYIRALGFEPVPGVPHVPDSGEVQPEHSGQH